MTRDRRALASLFLATAMAQAAHAALDVQTFRHLDGGENVAAIVTYAKDCAKSGEVGKALHFDFNGGTTPAVLSMPLPSGTSVTGTQVRLRLRGPMVNPVKVLVTDTGNVQTTHEVDRTAATPDSQGWSTVTLPVSAANAPRAINRIELQVRPPAAAADLGASGQAGTAYVRGIEILNQADGSDQSDFPSHVIALGTLSATGGTFEALPQVPGATCASDSLQKLAFDFSPAGSQYGAAVMDFTPVDATHARFRAKAPAGVRIRLHVVDTTNQLIQYDIDRSAEAVDAAGWATHSVRLDRPIVNGVPSTTRISGQVKSLGLQIRKATGGPVSGTAYFKEADLLQVAPSAHAPLVPRATPAAAQALSWWAASTNPTGQTTSVDSSDPIWGPVTTINYDFYDDHPKPLSRTIELPLTLTTPVAANRVTFQAKVPQGVSIKVRFKDGNNHTFDAEVAKPLATVDDAGWVQYSVGLESGISNHVFSGTVHELRLVLRRNTNISVTHMDVQPSGSALFRQVWVGKDTDQLDLSTATPAFATVKAANTPPLPGMLGVSSRKPDEDGALLQGLLDATSTGTGQVFKYARMDITWNSVATLGAPPVYAPTYNWTFKDNGVKAILDKGMIPILVLGYNHTAFTNGGGDKIGITQTANRDAYLKYVDDTVAHYQALRSNYQGGLHAGTPFVYEIWNEPNSNGFWSQQTGSASHYAALLGALGNRITQACANCKVVTGGLARIGFPTLEAMAPSLGDVTAVGVHPYTLYADVEPETQADEILAARAYLATLGVTKKLWTTELGYSSSLDHPLTVDGDAVKVDGSTDSARFRQAQRNVRELLTSIAVDNPMHVFYRLRDWYPDEGTNNVLEPEHNFGLFEKNAGSAAGPAKPALAALGALTNAVSNLKYQGVIGATPSNIQAIKFGKAPGDPATGQDTVFVAWANGPKRGGSITVLPDCAANTAVDIADGWASCITDVLGNAPASTVCKPAQAHGRVVCKVTESGGPLIIRTRR